MSKPAHNLPRSPLTAAQRMALTLKPRPLSASNTVINTGPLQVKRATGINASI